MCPPKTPTPKEGRVQRAYGCRHLLFFSSPTTKGSYGGLVKNNFGGICWLFLQASPASQVTRLLFQKFSLDSSFISPPSLSLIVVYGPHNVCLQLFNYSFKCKNFYLPPPYGIVVIFIVVIWLAG